MNLMIFHFSMYTKIIKSRTVEGGYYINGKTILLSNWGFHKSSTFFTDEEKKHFDKYIEDYKI